MAPFIALQRAEGVIAEDAGILASYWTQAWSLETVRAFHTLFGSVRARQPKGVGTLMVFQTSAIDARQFGDEPTRKELGRLQGAFDGYFRSTGIIIEGGGFVASALRSSTWALTTFLRMKNLPKYFDSADDAARHLSIVLADLGASKDSISRSLELAKTTALASARVF